jgi:flagellar basal body-associated protein FliL
MADVEAGAPAQGRNKASVVFQLVQTLLLVAVLVFLVKGRTEAPSHAPAAPAEGAPAAAAEAAPEGGEHGEAAPAAEGGAAPAVAAGPMVKISDLIVLLRDAEVDRYVKTSIDLELGNEADKTMLTSQLPRIQESFITYFADKTAEELRGSDGIGRAKRELLERVREIVPGRRVKNLYISFFVAQ